MKKRLLSILVVIAVVCQSAALVFAQDTDTGESAQDANAAAQTQEASQAEEETESAAAQQATQEPEASQEPEAAEDTEAEEETQTPLSAEAEALIALGFLESDLSMDAPVNRGELAEIMLKVYSPNMPVDAERPSYFFTDVQAGNPYAGAVYTAYACKLMNGYDGDYFGVIENATVNQAVAVLVNALGYTPIAERSGAYPLGYQMAANSLDLPLSGLTWNDEITMGQLAKLLYSGVQTDKMRPVTVGNRMEFEVVQGDTTLAEMDISTGVGQVTALGSYSITDTTGVQDGYLAIDRLPMEIGEWDADPDFVGRTVTYFYRAEDNSSEPELLYLVDRPERYDLISVPHRNVISLDSSQLSYYDEGDRMASIHLYGEMDVVYNRKYLSKLSYAQLDELLTDQYSVRLVGSQGQWETLIIENAVPVLAAGVSQDGATLYLSESTKWEGQTSVELQNEEIRNFSCSIYKDGEEQTPDAIQKYNVLSIMESADGAALTIVISDQSVSGTITAVETGRTISVDGTEFELAAGALFLNSDKLDAVMTEGPSILQAGTFYLNTEGEVAFARVSVSGQSLAYIKAYSVGKALDDSVQLEIFTEDEGWLVMNVRERLELDGTTVSRSELPAVLDRISLDQRLVKYKANSEGELTFLDTVILGPNESNDSMTCVLTGHTTNIDYYQGYNIDGLPYKVWNGTKILVLPADKNDKELYRFVDKTYFEYNNQYTMDIYNISESLIIGAVVINGGSMSSEYEDYPSVIREVAQCLTEEGELATKWTVTSPSGMSTATVKSVISDPEEEDDSDFFEYAYDEYRQQNIRELQPGDVVKFMLDETGSVVKIKLYFRPTSPPAYGIYNHATNDEYGYGELLVKDETNNFMVVQKSDTLTSDDDKVAYLLRVILIYDSKSETVALANISELFEGENVFVTGNLGHVDLTYVVR